MKRDRLLVVAAWALRALLVVNAVMLVVFVGGLIGSFVFAGALDARLLAKYGAAFDASAAIAAMRSLGLLGLLLIGVLHVIFTSLLRMVASVEAGDPFVAVNAARLQTIGWALLAAQVIDLGFGAVAGWMVSIGAEIGAGWQPSTMGWLAVLLVFVLARVFKIGARMRDEIEGTI